MCWFVISLYHSQLITTGFRCLLPPNATLYAFTQEFESGDYLHVVFTNPNYYPMQKLVQAIVKFLDISICKGRTMMQNHVLQKLLDFLEQLLLVHDV